jgi:hypothetical protein
LRRRTVAKLLKREGAPAREIERGLADEDGQGPIARRAHKHRLRLRRRDRLNVAHDQEYELSESESSSSSSESEEEGGGWFSKKDAEAEAAWKAKKEQEKKERKAAKKAAKKAGKDSDKGKDKDNDKKDKGKKKKTKKKTDKQFRVWVGGAGFDIGREFVARDPTPAPSTAITPETLLSSDPIDVLGDELDAIQERQDTEQVADELWNTVGFPGELLPPVDESGTVLEAGQGDDDQLTGDDVSFVTAKTRPPLGIGSKGKQREDRLPDDIPFMTARTRPTMTSGSRQSRGKQSEGIAEDASFTTPTRPTMASGSRQSTGKREDLTDDASFTTLTRPPPKPISGHSSSVSSAGDSFVTALSTSLPSSHGDVPDPALTPPPGSPDASPPETPAPQRISALALGLQRPPMSPRSSTTETYRSQQTVVEVHEHGHGHGNEPQGSEPPALPAQPTVIPPSPESVANPSPHGTYSSGRPLLNASDDEGSVHAGDSPSPVRRVTSSSSRPGIPQLLKSALRPEPTETPSTTKEPKTVKWIPTSLSPKNRKAALADTSSTSSPKSQPKSQLEPANPIDVLSRTGEDARGTSAEASTKASVIDQDDFMPGGFVMRDRALVKVGRHRDEEIRVFDEEFAVRV